MFFFPSHSLYRAKISSLFQVNVRLQLYHIRLWLIIIITSILNFKKKNFRKFWSKCPYTGGCIAFLFITVYDFSPGIFLLLHLCSKYLYLYMICVWGECYHRWNIHTNTHPVLTIVKFGPVTIHEIKWTATKFGKCNDIKWASTKLGEHQQNKINSN